MRRIVYGVILLLLSPQLRAADDPKTDKDASPQKQLEALVQKFDKEMEKAIPEARKAYEAAKTAEEKQKVLENFRKKPHAYAARFLDLARKYPKDQAAVDALAWIVGTVGEGKEADEAVDLLLKEHVDKVGDLYQTLGQSDAKVAERLLRGVLEKSQDHKVQAQATYGLAQLQKTRSENPDAKPAEVKKASEEAEQLYDRLVTKFADVKDLARPAEEGLAEIRKFGIGKKAPEISGEDGDGKKFKLSDYKGKVVVLDFWFAT
jgi:hypothetical protein